MYEDYRLPIYVTWLPLVLISVAVIFNTVTTVVLLVNRVAKNINCFTYLAVIAIFDTMCLFTWNLNQFLTPNFGIQIENYNIYTCRIFLYMQFTSVQISSLLRSLLCIERYYFVMKFSNLIKFGKYLFGTKKSVKFWIISVIIFSAFINIHLLFNTGSFEVVSDKQEENLSSSELKFNCYDNNNALSLKLLWNRFNLITALVIPSSIMIIFDWLLFYRTYLAKKKTRSHSSLINFQKSKSFTASLIYISIAYLVLHTPANLYFSFINHDVQHDNEIISFVIVELHFLPHSILFFELYLTNKKFYNILQHYYDKRESNVNETRSPVINLSHCRIYIGRDIKLANNSRL